MKGGRANQGRAWQLLLDLHHDRYRREGRAVIVATPPPVKVLSRLSEGGTFRACFLGLGPPDYAGVVAGFPPSVLGTARAVAFDAKDCSGPRWSYGDLPEHQAQDLDDWERLGGIAFVALRLQGVGWVLPWSELGGRWHAWSATEGVARPGTASLAAQDLEGWAHRMPRPGDWIEALP